MHPELQALLGTSPAMQELGALVETTAREHRHILLAGEVGVGKSRVARLMHALSERADAQFIALDPMSLENGQLCGAATYFIDEIALASPDGQARLLQSLDNAAIVAATECDLATEVTEGRFSEALYYRLGLRPIHLPPLRARASADVRTIATHLVAALHRGLPTSPGQIAERALDTLGRYHWPANVRELSNVLERALLQARGANWVDVVHLPPEVLEANDDVLHVHAGHTLAQVEQMHIQRTLRVQSGNRTRAARDLGISRATLIKKIREYELAERDRMTTVTQESA